MTCRYDRETRSHLLREHRADCTRVDCLGCLPCRHDEHGNPVRHCRVRVRCTSHLGWDDHACPRCVGKIRTNLDVIVDLMSLMPAEAAERGIDSEPFNLAGPHADYVSAQWRLINADRDGQQVEELDLRDPYTCLTMHERTIREDLGHDATLLVSPNVAASAGYLAWVLTDLARDEDRALTLASMLGDTGRLRTHMEAALLDSRTPERGAPCHLCVGAGKGAPRVVRRYAEDMPDDSLDRWECPADRAHQWTHAEYLRWSEERTRAG